MSGEIQGKELHPPLHLDVVVIEKGVIGSPLIKVGQIIFYLEENYHFIKKKLRVN